MRKDKNQKEINKINRDEKMTECDNIDCSDIEMFRHQEWTNIVNDKSEKYKYNDNKLSEPTTPELNGNGIKENCKVKEKWTRQ